MDFLHTVLDFIEELFSNPEETYKNKIGFNVPIGTPRSLEIYPVERPVGFLKSWEGK